MGLLDIFVEREEKPQKPPEKSRRAPVVQDIGSAAITPIQTYSPGIVDSTEVQNFRAKFARILEDENKRNHPGNDYYEYIIMKNAMNAIADETLRYQMAFQGWKAGTTNLTKEFLLETANKYLGLVDKEIQDFQAAYNQQHESAVGTQEKAIAQKNTEIQALMEKINKLSAEVAEMKQVAMNNSSKLVATSEAFTQAGDKQRQEILDEISKINQFIN